MQCVSSIVRILAHNFHYNSDNIMPAFSDKAFCIYGICSFAISLPHWPPSEQEDRAFVHLNIGILPGRTPETKQAIGKAVLQVSYHLAWS
jgi:5-carboxymethyl-2-hydroxymuconate isomerase